MSSQPIPVRLENLEQGISSHAVLFTTVVPWFGKPYEQSVSIYMNEKGEVYYQFPQGWNWYPVELKKHSQYIYINGQVLYIH
jgi:hypothetical protein